MILAARMRNGTPPPTNILTMTPKVFLQVLLQVHEHRQHWTDLAETLRGDGTAAAGECIAAWQTDRRRGMGRISTRNRSASTMLFTTGSSEQSQGVYPDSSE